MEIGHFFETRSAKTGEAIGRHNTVADAIAQAHSRTAEDPESLFLVYEMTLRHAVMTLISTAPGLMDTSPTQQQEKDA